MEVKQYTLTEDYREDEGIGAVIIAGICDGCLANSVIAPTVVVRNGEAKVIGWSLIEADKYKRPEGLIPPSPHHPEDDHIPSFLRRGKRR